MLLFVDYNVYYKQFQYLHKIVIFAFGIFKLDIYTVLYL